MQDGGDGTNIAPITGQEHEGLPPVEGEQSGSQADLEAKIEQELGLPHTEPKAEAVVEPVVEAEEVKEPEEEAETVAEAAPKAEPVEPTNQEFFIEVEDADGVTHKISSLDDLPEDFQYKNARQPLQIYKQIDKLEADKFAYDHEQEQAAATAAEETAQKEQFSAWDKEIAELGKEKRISATDQDTVNKVFEHMSEINAARTKAGNPNLITSFEDALDKYEASQAKAAQVDKTKAENDRAKAKASLIGGGTSTAAGSSSQPYVSGRYRSIDDIPVSL